MSTQTTRPLDHLGFIHLVPFERSDPARGLQEGIELFRYAEELGLDSGWVRTRHMQYGLPSPAVYFAALAQHTERIGLGSAVIPVGHGNSYRWLQPEISTPSWMSSLSSLSSTEFHYKTRPARSKT